MVDNESSGGSSLLFFMCGFTMIVVLSCITFVTYGVKQRQQEITDYYASPLTKEQIDEAWEKFEQREEIRKALRKPSLKEKLPEYPGY